MDYELGDEGDVAQLQQIAIDDIVPVVVVHLAGDQVGAPQCELEALVTAHDADVVPHRPAQLLPGVTDEDLLVTHRGAAALPGGRGAFELSCAACLDGVLCCTMAKNEGF